MGAGKTAVGRRLAALLDLPFVDSDSEIEARTGVDVAYIFEREGEAGFRKRESQVIDELTCRDGIVLATGGGAILDEANRRHLAGRGTVVYLHASVDQQHERTRRSRNRPLLALADPRARLAELMELRGPLYESVADLVVPTDRRHVQTVAREIVRRLQHPGADPGPP